MVPSMPTKKHTYDIRDSLNSESMADSFWRRVRKGDGCWIWTGEKYQNGYGRFNWRYSPRCSTTAHRAAYMLTNGPIADGMIACHRCDVRDCVNPSHIFIGSHLDNMRDMREKGRGSTGASHAAAVSIGAQKGEDHWTKRTPGRTSKGATHYSTSLTEDDVREIRRRSAGSETQRAIAAEFGLSEPTVSSIVHRKRWAHVH